jgi:hypothetical protein
MKLGGIPHPRFFLEKQAYVSKKRKIIKPVSAKPELAMKCFLPNQ